MIVALAMMVIGLFSPSPATGASTPAFVMLDRDGALRQQDGRVVARGFETIASVMSREGLVATRGDEVRLISLDTGESKLLLKGMPSARFAELSPDGEFLACCAAVDGHGEIFLATRGADGGFTNPRSIARGYGPAFSSDGRFVYFEDGDRGLARFDVHRGVTEPFVPKHVGAHTVRCSSDGKWIAFSMNRALYLYRTAERTVVKLTDGKAYDRFPSFAGDEILFFREISPDKHQVISIRADGTKQRVVFTGDVILVCALPAKSSR